jgi:Holliday junction resolvase RusA-like endonuclease
MLLAAFVVPGQPVPKARARVVGRHAYTPKKTREAEERIAGHYKVRYPHAQPTTARLRVVLRFFLKGSRADADNLTKLFLDAGNGRIWRDDAQIDQLDVSVVRSDPEPRTSVEVWEL